MQDKSVTVFREHARRLKALDASPTLTDLADVLSNRILEQVGARPRWVSYPW